MDLAAWFQELKRRRVIRALLGWGLFSFAVLQVIDPLLRALDLKEWVLKVVVAVLAVGFPVTAGLAWAFDLTRKGIERTGPAEGATPATARKWAGARPAVVLVLVGALIGAGVAWMALRQAGPAAPAVPPSIAILPFADLSPGRDQEYFADGVAEAVLNALTHVKGLKVVGRTSSFSFKGKKDDLKSIGRTLDAAHVLEGSVRKDGSRIRITALLVKAADGYHLWSETYDREIIDIFDVQSEIAQTVVAKLAPMLVGRLDATPATTPATTPAAYGEYLLGRHLHEGGSVRSSRLAIEAYERALSLDGTYPPAWAGLANSLTNSFLLDQEADRARTTRRAALVAAERAVSLDPGLAQGYFVRHRLRRMSWDWAGARADLDRARAIDPGASAGEYYGGWMALYVPGDPLRAIGHFRKATEVDPLHAWSWAGLGRAHLERGEMELARRALQRSLDIAPDHEWAVRWMGEVEFFAGNFEGARSWWRRSTNEANQIWSEAVVEHALGHDAASSAALGEFARKYGNRYPLWAAKAHAARGERDLAFEWIERAFAVHNDSLESLKADVWLKPLHSDPRWKALLRKMNLPVD